MRTARLRIAVLGDGGWGTTLALHLHALKHHVTLWGAFAEQINDIRRRRENARFLPGIPIPRALALTADLDDAVRSSDLIVLAIPSPHLRSVLRGVPPRLFRGRIVVNVAKGIEVGSLNRMSQVVEGEIRHTSYAVLSGPNIAREIATGHPGSAVVASTSSSVAKRVQSAFTGRRFRLYTSSDVIGVELGGALKNPIAIAAGIADGFGFGANTKAALITRGLVEMARLGVAMGAREATFRGLSGLGDLVTTCLGGRNRQLGERIGRGERLSSLLKQTGMVIEGVETSKAAVQLGRRHRVELPIIEQIHAVLFKRKPARQALRSLLQRTVTSE